MHLTLLLPGALIPALMAPELIDTIRAPRLQARLARATPVEETVASGVLRGAAHLAWLNPRLFDALGDAPSAPYVYAALTGRPPDADSQLFRAQPIHFGFARDHLVIEPIEPRPTMVERQALMSAVASVCVAHDCELTDVDGHWFLQPANEWRIDTVPFAAAMGRPAGTTLVTGADASRWSRLHNEIQMLWHEHDVNRAREAIGQRVINGIWLDGGGHWRPLSPSPFATLHADALELHGAALAAGVRYTGSREPPADRSLIIRDELYDAVTRNDWSDWMETLARFDEWLAPLSPAKIDFVLAGRERVRTRRSTPWDRWLRWRPAALSEVFAE